MRLCGSLCSMPEIKKQRRSLPKVWWNTAYSALFAIGKIGTVFAILAFMSLL